MLGFSIIICTYNPEFKIFKRLLNAVQSFGSEALSKCEIIIVDNNSSIPLTQNIAVVEFLASVPNAKLIREATPGLTNARIAGIKVAKYDWIIFFDDDNEPKLDYLIAAEDITEKHPEVGIWGPGNITVEYFERRATSFLNEMKVLFQERKMDNTVFDNDIIKGNACYPYGTGMLVRRVILDSYIGSVNRNEYTMSDRTGQSLISAGDTQILYTGLKMNYYAGSSPKLQLTHVITANKLKLKYILKLIYSLHSGQIKAYNEVFYNKPHFVKPVSAKEAANPIFTFFISLRNSVDLKQNLVTLSERMGYLNARIMAGNFSKPFFIKSWEKIIGV
ncbi:glycosyltransferase [Segetibacter koreensis]|uniref:glycosyltransferase n=1 Tax=Segetibacter koreensis TaxID=398037 RepID=UPI00035E50AB|nr:glycosyltransferase [Segetibacter koreensis]